MDKEKYEILLDELLEAIKNKNDKINLQEHIIATLTRHVDRVENTLKSIEKDRHIEKREGIHE